MGDRRDDVSANRISSSDGTAALTRPSTSSPPLPTTPLPPQQQPSNCAPRSRDLGPILFGSGGRGNGQRRIIGLYMHRRTHGAGQLSRNRCRTYCNRGIIFITVVCLFCARNRFLRSSPVPAVDTTLARLFVLFSYYHFGFCQISARQLSIFVIIIISNIITIRK